MDIQSIVRDAMKAQGATQKVLGERVGMTQPSLSNALGTKTKGMGVDVAVKLLDALNYELVAVPKGTKLPKGGYRVGQRGSDE